MNITQTHWLQKLCFFLLISGVLVGCSDYYQHFRDEADESAIRRLDEIDTKYQTESPRNFTPARDTLRRRLLMDQNLPTADPASIGSDQLPEPNHWPEPGLLSHDTTTTQPATKPQITDSKPLKITLSDALKIGAHNNREYQRIKENIYREALDLDLAKDAFRGTYIGLLSSLFNVNSTGDSTTNQTLQSGDVEFSQTLKTGATLGARLGIDIVNLLTQDTNDSMGLFAELTWSIPLLSGAGWHVVTEPLTQAERDTLYAITRLERYKRTYAVNVASDYLRVLQSYNRVDNALENYKRLRTQAARTRDLADAGRLPPIEVGQAEQQELNARNNWLNAQQNAANAMDNFKVLIGLPPDAQVILDPDELLKLEQLTTRYFGELNSEKTQSAAGDSTTQPAPNKTKDILIADIGQVGPLEIEERRAILIALKYRRDLMIQRAQLYDAQRDIIVASDALLPRLDLTGDINWGGSKGLGSAGTDNSTIRLNQLNFNSRLNFDLPWERTSQSAAYRQSLLNLENSVRDMQALEDEIKLGIRRELRELTLARRSYIIQLSALEIAKQRVESTRLFLEAGKAQVRDVLDAQADLLNAQNNLIGAMVDYRIAELQLMRDMGVMQMSNDGGFDLITVPQTDQILLEEDPGWIRPKEAYEPKTDLSITDLIELED